MGKRGPAPKPTAKKKLEGTYRGDRAPKAEPTPKSSAPNPPTWLGKGKWGRESLREWKRLAPQLERLGLLTEIDRADLVGYCEAWGRFWYFRRLLEKGEKWTQVTDTGYVAQRPEVTFMNRALEDLKKFGALFGLSPSDRTRISVEANEGEKGQDPAEALLFGGPRIVKEA